MSDSFAVWPIKQGVYVCFLCCGPFLRNGKLWRDGGFEKYFPELGRGDDINILYRGLSYQYPPLKSKQTTVVLFDVNTHFYLGDGEIVTSEGIGDVLRSSPEIFSTADAWSSIGTVRRHSGGAHDQRHPERSGAADLPGPRQGGQGPRAVDQAPLRDARKVGEL